MGALHICASISFCFILTQVQGELPFEPEYASFYPDVCFSVEGHKFLCHKVRNGVPTTCTSALENLRLTYWALEYFLFSIIKIMMKTITECYQQWVSCDIFFLVLEDFFMQKFIFLSFLFNWRYFSMGELIILRCGVCFTIKLIGYTTNWK